MDIRCTKCGEPWDMDSLHDIAGEAFEAHHRMTYTEYRKRRGGDAAQKAYDVFYAQARKQWTAKGCELFDANHTGEVGGNTAQVSAILHEFMGDDLDGVASMLDDARYLGVID